MDLLLVLEVLMYAFALWLGLYLLSRNPADVRLNLAGLGLLAYAIGLGLDILVPGATPAWQARLRVWQSGWLLLPALLWLALLAMLLRGEEPWRRRLARQPRPYAVLLAATIFFGLGLGLWLLPQPWLPRRWLLPAIGVDLLVLGGVIGLLDAFNEGEALRPHIIRSAATAAATVLVFGGQVVLVMAVGHGVSQPLLLLLLGTISAAVLVPAFGSAFHTWLDRVAFPRLTHLQQQRAARRSAAAAESRLDRQVDVTALPEAEFARLTRRALSHMGNLPRLASNPLTRLPLVESRLRQDGRPTATLERAGALKIILSESIERLKPPGGDRFGVTDEWRHFNALYFPYVAGLRPYSRRASHQDLDEAAAQALVWFQVEVPQRTLYNWQTAAAALVARDLRERSRRLRPA